MSRHAFRLILLSGLTILLAFLIVTDAVSLLRGPSPGSDEWYWPYFLRPISRWWFPFLAALLIIGIAAWWQKRPEKSKMAVAALVLSNLLLQSAVIYAERPAVLAELVDRTLSEGTTSYFQPAAGIENLDSFLTGYHLKMPDFPSDHSRTHPPGLILLNWLLIRAFSLSPAAAEMIAQQIRPLRCIDLWLLEQPPPVVAGLGAASVLPLLLGSLTIIPGFFLARRLLSPAAAKTATVLMATIPALLVFAPNNVQIDALLAMTALLALNLGLERDRIGWFFASGLLVSVATFFSLGNSVLLLPLAAFAGACYLGRVQNSSGQDWPKLADWRNWAGSKLWRYLAAFISGTAVIWLVFWIGWNVQPVEVARTSIEQHYLLVTAKRNYWWWLVYNPVDLLLFGGLALAAGFLGAIWSAGKQLSGSEIRPVDGLALGLGLLVLLLNFSGSTRGEVGRLWLFIMPMMAIPAAGFLERVFSGRQAMVLIIGLQLLLALAIGLAWRPMQAVIVVAQRPAEPAASIVPETALDLTFVEPQTGQALLQLTGFDLEIDQAEPGRSVSLMHYWQAIQPAQRPYTVFNHLVDENGELAAQQDNWPVQGQWPPTCWQRNERVTDSYTIELPVGLAAGEYRLMTGLYDAANFDRLRLENGQDAVQLATVTIE